MSGYLLDTNVLSEVMKRQPAVTVIEQLRAAPANRLFTSSICVMEMRYGAARHPSGPRLWRRIERDVLPRVRILAVGMTEARRAGDLLASLARVGAPIGTEDVLIAATALVHDLVVSTRNLSHFERVPGLVAESWWEGASRM